MKDDYILVLDNKHKGEYNNQTIRYKIVPADELKPEELKIYKKIQWTINNRGGTTTKRSDTWNRSMCFIRGTKEQVEDSLKDLTENDTDTRYKPFVPMKKKTREHFGSIVEDVFGAKIEDMFNTGESYILILKHHYVNDENFGLVGNKIKYILKPVDMITPEESAVLNSKKTREAHTYIHGYEVNDEMGADEVEFIFDTKEELEADLKELRSLNSDLTPEIPMKSKTREHFGSIVESVFKSKIEDMFQSGEGYVLIIKTYFNHNKEGEINGFDKRKYTIKHVSNITPVESAVLNSKKTRESHAYMHGYEVYDEMGADEVEFIFDTKEELEEEIRELKTLTKDIYPEIPMKAKTKEHFGDIMEKVSFIAVVSSLLEKYELDEKIIAPAIKVGNKVVKGKRGDMHINVLERIANRIATIHSVSIDKAYDIMSKMRENGKIVEGFIDVNGRFATREKAYDIMKYFKSIKNDTILDRGPNNNRFYSEDL